MKLLKKTLTFAVLTMFVAAGAIAAAGQEPASKTAAKSTAKSTSKAKASSSADAAKKEHQLTGTINAVSDTSLTITHRKNKEGKTETTFTLSGDTKKDGELKKDAKVTVFYHEDGGKMVASRVKAAPAAAAASTKKAAKSKDAKKTS